MLNFGDFNSFIKTNLVTLLPSQKLPICHSLLNLKINPLNSIISRVWKNGFRQWSWRALWYQKRLFHWKLPRMHQWGSALEGDNLICKCSEIRILDSWSLMKVKTYYQPYGSMLRFVMGHCKNDKLNFLLLRMHLPYHVFTADCF